MLTIQLSRIEIPIEDIEGYAQKKTKTSFSDLFEQSEQSAPCEETPEKEPEHLDWTFTITDEDEPCTLQLAKPKPLNRESSGH